MPRPDPLELSVSRVIDAPAEIVYDLIADVTKMGDYSPENTGAVWLDGAAGPAVGARFKGDNRIGPIRWDLGTIQEGNRVLARALRRMQPGPYQVQAVIASCTPLAASCSRDPATIQPREPRSNARWRSSTTPPNDAISNAISNAISTPWHRPARDGADQGDDVGKDTATEAGMMDRS